MINDQVGATYVAKITEIVLCDCHVCIQYPPDVSYDLVIEVGGKFITHNGNGRVVNTLDEAAQEFIDECALDGGATVTFTKAG